MGTCFQIVMLAAGLILVLPNLRSCSPQIGSNETNDEGKVMESNDNRYNEALEVIQEKALLEEDKTLSPVIGILSQVLRDYKRFVDEPHLHIVASYVKWLEGSGARVLPILLDQNDEYYGRVFKKTNGLLFPGGDNFLNPNKSTPMMDAAKKLYKLAIEANDKGDFYPIWGTCLGLELLSVLTSGKNKLSLCSANDVALNLRFISRGKLFAKQSNYDGIHVDNFTDSIVDALEQKNITYNFHHKCLTREDFLKLSLDKFYRDLAYSSDINGLEFIAAFEAKDYPFYGVQFHPEKESYEFVEKSSQKNIPHTWESIAASRYFSDFFVRLARKNGHETNSKEDRPNLIYSYSPSYTALVNDMYEQRYLFPSDGQSMVEHINPIYYYKDDPAQDLPDDDYDDDDDDMDNATTRQADISQDDKESN